MSDDLLAVEWSGLRVAVQQYLAHHIATKPVIPGLSLRKHVASLLTELIEVRLMNAMAEYRNMLPAEVLSSVDIPAQITAEMSAIHQAGERLCKLATTILFLLRACHDHPDELQYPRLFPRFVQQLGRSHAWCFNRLLHAWAGERECVESADLVFLVHQTNLTLYLQWLRLQAHWQPTVEYESDTEEQEEQNNYLCVTLPTKLAWQNGIWFLRFVAVLIDQTSYVPMEQSNMGHTQHVTPTHLTPHHARRLFHHSEAFRLRNTVPFVEQRKIWNFPLINNVQTDILVEHFASYMMAPFDWSACPWSLVATNSEITGCTTNDTLIHNKGLHNANTRPGGARMEPTPPEQVTCLRDPRENRQPTLLDHAHMMDTTTRIKLLGEYHQYCQGIAETRAEEMHDLKFDNSMSDDENESMVQQAAEIGMAADLMAENAPAAVAIHDGDVTATLFRQLLQMQQRVTSPRRTEEVDATAVVRMAVPVGGAVTATTTNIEPSPKRLCVEEEHSDLIDMDEADDDEEEEAVEESKTSDSGNSAPPGGDVKRTVVMAGNRHQSASDEEDGDSTSDEDHDREDEEEDEEDEEDDNPESAEAPEHMVFRVCLDRRSNLITSMLNAIGNDPNDHHLPINVKFLHEEQTFDHGGPTSECFSLCFQQLLHPGSVDRPNPLWDVDDETKMHWPRRTHPDASPIVTDFVQRMWYRIGVLIGLAVYNNQWAALSLPFPPRLFFAALKREAIDFSDLKHSRPLFAKRLSDLLELNGQAVEQLNLDHELCGSGIILRDDFDTHHLQTSTEPLFQMLGTRPGTWELIPGGCDTPVTQSNLTTYVDNTWKALVGLEHFVDVDAGHVAIVVNCPSALANHNAREMFRGIASLINEHEFDLFTTRELVHHFYLNPASIANLTVVQMRKQTVLEAFCEQTDTMAHDFDYVEWFWSIVAEWDVTLRARLLYFATGDCDFGRQVMNGVATWIVQRGPRTETELPTASTCFKTLVLPVYSSRELLQSKLRLAIENAEGFGLA